MNTPITNLSTTLLDPAGSMDDLWNGPDDLTDYGDVSQLPELPPFDCESPVQLTENTSGSSGRISGRGVLCRCFRGTSVSTTIRVAREESKGKYVVPRAGNCPDSPYKPSDGTSTQYPISIAALVERIGELSGFERGVVGPRGDGEILTPGQGMILITGATASAKSQVARGLIHQVINRRLEEYASRSEDQRRTDRRPHLVTIENPIEKLYCESAEAARRCGLDYTPREIGIDTKSVEAALLSALRQTPTVVYLGEIRKSREWKAALEFASTGHLLIATAHAGSLTEAIGRALDTTGSRTPVARGQLASQVLAVVHLRKSRVVSAAGQHIEVVLPAMWRRTRISIADLVADGLASLLPCSLPRGADAAKLSASGSIGRSWFAQALIGKNITTSPPPPSWKTELLRLARRSDLDGL